SAPESRSLTAGWGLPLGTQARRSRARRPERSPRPRSPAGGRGGLTPARPAGCAPSPPPHPRARAPAAPRVPATPAVCGGGQRVAGFVALFVLNAAGYVIYIGVLAVVVRGNDARPEPAAGGYRSVLRDRAFGRLAVINVAVIAVGWGAFTWLVPPYARNSLGI